MTVNPYDFHLVSGVQSKLSTSPSFGDTLSASLGYQYDPIFETIGNAFKYRDTLDTSYNPMQDMEGYEDFATDLVDAKNSEHMLDMKRAIDENKERREVLYNSSILSQIGAGIFDPVNAIALPFGGFGVGIGRSALRVGAGVAGIQGLMEGARYPFDPLATPEESAFNIGTAFIGGMLLGGAVAIPLTKRAKVQQQTQKDIQHLNRLIGNIEDGIRTGDFVYHGTNLRGKSLDSFIDEDGNLNLRGSADDFVGEKQLGVSLGDNFDTSINYTAFKDKIQGTRDPASQGGNDSVVFRIKKEVLEKYKNRSESMGEIFVEGDMKIAKGDFEVIRFGKENTGNQSSFNSKLEVKEPFAETKIDVLKARKDGIPKEEFGLNKNKAKLETQQEKLKERQNKSVSTDTISKQDVIKKLNNSESLNDYVFHRTLGVQENIHTEGLKSGGVTGGSPITDRGYGEIVYVFRKSDFPFGKDKNGKEMFDGGDVSLIKDGYVPAKPITAFHIDELTKVSQNYKRGGGRTQELGDDLDDEAYRKYMGQSKEEFYGKEVIDAEKAFFKKNVLLLNKAFPNKKQAEPKGLTEKITTIQKQIDGINRTLDENQRELIEVNKELQIRNQLEVENTTRGIDNPYGFDSNLFMDSFLFKGLSTAMKRVLQSNAPDSVKLNFLKLANDSGLRLNLNKHGRIVGNSVHQEKEVLNGEWIAIHDQSRKLYGEVYNKTGPTYDVDINKRSYNEWLEGVNEKHIKGLPLDENEKQLSKLWTEHWTKWEKRLRETGLIGDTVSMQKKVLNNQVRTERKINKIKEMEDKIPENERKVDELIDSLKQSNAQQGIKAENIMDDLTAKKAEGFFSKKMYELEVKLREQKAKGIFFTDKQHALFSKLSKQKITKNFLTDPQYERLKNLRRSRDRLIRETDDLEANLKEMGESKILPANEESFFPRFLLKHKIRENRDVFVERLVNWFRENPKIMVRNKYGELEVRPALSVEEKIRSTKPEALLKRANDTTDRILGLDDMSDESVQFFGYGKSKHFKHRSLDIPNNLITEFIELNPTRVMRAYNQRVAGQYQFQKAFNRSLDDVLDDMDDDLFQAGKSMDEINATRKDFMHMHDRIVGRVLREPNTWDQKTARVLKDGANFGFLGSAGFATLPDFSKIMMEHELGDILKGLVGILRDNRVNLTASEGRLAGEMADLLKGDVHMRLSEDMVNNPLDDGLMGKVRNAYFFLTGLTPMTHSMKFLDSVVRGHTLIKISRQISEGKASAQDLMKLAQYNIDEAMARRIAKMPFEETDGGLILPNTTKWADAEAVQSFRNSMNTGILNTVMMGTPADKPNIVDGVVYIPMRVAKRFGLSEDAKYRGYARIENGLLGLPFQFYSYSFAAANKITASFAQGQVKNRASAVVASIALGYMAMDLKTPDYIMEKMSWSDTLARSIDQSGLLAMYSDVYYRALHTSVALGGPDIGMGTINPKFPVKPGYTDPILDILGAGPSIAYDIGSGVADLVNGKTSEGAKQVVRSLPGARLWFWKDEMNQLTNSFKSFGRY